MDNIGYTFSCRHKDWEQEKNISFRPSVKVTVDFCQQNRKIKMEKNKIGHFSEFFSEIFKHYSKEDKNLLFTLDFDGIKKEEDDGRCFKILRKYLSKGCVEEEIVSKTTIENLLVLARNLELEPIESKCKELLKISEPSILLQSEFKIPFFSCIGQKTVEEAEKTISIEQNLSPRKISTCKESPLSRRSISAQDLALGGRKSRIQFSRTLLSKGVVHAGEYFLRVAESCYYALEKCFQTPEGLGKKGEEKLNELFSKAQKLYMRGLCFDQCQRKEKLNAVAFCMMLSDALEKKGFKITEDVENNLEELAILDEREGRWSRSKETPEEKFDYMVDFLAERKYLSYEEGESVRSELELSEELALIRLCLQARAGLKVSSEIFEIGEKWTRAYYKVENLEDEKRLDKNVEEFCSEVEKFMVDYGYLDRFHVKFVEKLNFNDVFKKK